MIYRIYPIKDSSVTNDFRLGARMTASNTGQAESLTVFKRPGVTGAIGDIGSSSLGRSFMQFDFSAYAALTASGIIPTTGSAYRLRVAHLTSNDPLPFSFDLTLSPISKVWDEGRGMDSVDLADKGFVNWVQPQQGTYWTTLGGDLLTSPTATVHFDTGYENIDTDLTTMVGSWLTGGLTNDGLCISMTGSIEIDSNYGNFFNKKFYSRQSSYLDRRPYLEVQVADHLLDDRLNMAWNTTGSLFLYNIVQGQYVNTTGPIITTVSDASGVLASVTASLVSTGIYSASFALPTGSTYSGSVFYDRWGAGGVSLMSSSFIFWSPTSTPSIAQNILTARVRNLQPEYTTDDTVRFGVLFRRRPGVLPVLSTASLGVPPYIVQRGYYAIENDSTRERVVTFGTGSDETRLSYDGTGNYFTFYMSNLNPGNVYRIIFMVNELGRKQIIDPGARFKVI